MKKTIDTLLSDIDAIFTNPNHKVSEENLDIFCNTLRSVIKEHIEKAGNLTDPVLRVSILGTPNRKLYFDLNEIKDKDKERLNPQLQQRFLFGHVVEALMLFLAREAGHKVEHEQLEVDVDGVPGHIDSVIDDTLTDLKSASPYQFPKFRSVQTLRENDSFGYLTQISSYHKALTKSNPSVDKDRAAIWAYNKSDGQKQLLIVDEMDMINVEDRVTEVKQMLNLPTAPEERCYQPVNQSKTSPNKVLAKGCQYCRHKFKCWDLRVFDYAGGYTYFTEVVNEPSVPEVTELVKNKKEIADEEVEV